MWLNAVLKFVYYNKYESFDVECLINDDDNNYYLIFYSYCKSNNNDDKSIGVKKIIIVNSDKNGSFSDESVDFFKDLDEYGFYPNI